MSPCHSHRYLLGFFRKALKRKLSWGCLKSYTQNINVMILHITFNQIRAFTFFSFTQNLGHLVKIDLASKWRISKVYTLLFVSIKMVKSIKSWIYLINLIYIINFSLTEIVLIFYCKFTEIYVVHKLYIFWNRIKSLELINVHFISWWMMIVNVSNLVQYIYVCT